MSRHNKAFHDHIKNYLVQDEALSMRKLSRAAGLSSTYVGVMLEKKSDPHLGNACVIAEITGTPLWKILKKADQQS